MSNISQVVIYDYTELGTKIGNPSWVVSYTLENNGFHKRKYQQINGREVQRIEKEQEILTELEILKIIKDFKSSEDLWMTITFKSGREKRI